MLVFGSEAATEENHTQSRKELFLALRLGAFA